MAVAFDAATESHTGTSGSTSATSFTWDHVPSGTPSAVLVFTFTNANANDATAVTYGGVPLVAVTGGRAVDTAGEAGDCKLWLLERTTLTGTQPVVVSRNNNGNEMYAVSITVTAATAAVECTGIQLTQTDGTWSELSVDDGSLSGTNSVRFAAVNSGLSGIVDNPSTPGTNNLSRGANSTAVLDIDFGNRVIFVVRETTAGTGSRSVGFSATTSDDRAAVHVAVREMRSAALSDAAKVSETATVVLNLGVSLTDAITVADFWVSSDPVTSQTDAVRVVDTATAILDLTTSKTEAVNISGSGTINLLPLAGTSWLRVSDLANVTLAATDLTASGSDAVRVTDTLTPALGLALSLADAVTATDALTPPQLVSTETLIVSATDAVRISETGTPALDLATSQTDAITASDTATPALGLAVSASESIAAAQTGTINLLPLPGSSWLRVSDLAVVTIENAGLTSSGSEAITVADSLAPALGLATSQSEAGAVVDTATAALGLAISQAEAVTVTETATPALGLAVSASETITAAQTGTIHLWPLPGSSWLRVSDAAFVTVENAGLTASGSEAITVADNLTPALGLATSQSDALTMTDAATPALGLAASATEAITVADALTPPQLVSTETLIVSATEAVTTAESALPALGLATTQTDAVAIADTAVPPQLVATGTMTVSATDAITASTSGQVVLHTSGSWLHISDTAIVTLAESGTLTTTQTEAIGVADALTPPELATGTLTVSATEAVTASTAGQIVLHTSGSWLRISDSALVEVMAAGPTVTATEAVRIADTAMPALDLALTQTEVVRVADAVDSWAELLIDDGVRIADQLVDIQLVFATLDATSTDAIRVADTAFAVLHLATSQVESVTVADALTPPVLVSALMVPAADALTVSDAAQAYLTPLLATATDGARASETATVALDLAVSVTEAVHPADSVPTWISTTLISAADAIRVVDTAQAVVTPLLVSAAEAARVADGVQAGMDLLSVTVADEIVIVQDVFVQQTPTPQPRRASVYRPHLRASWYRPVLRASAEVQELTATPA